MVTKSTKPLRDIQAMQEVATNTDDSGAETGGSCPLAFLPGGARGAVLPFAFSTIVTKTNAS